MTRVISVPILIISSFFVFCVCRISFQCHIENCTDRESKKDACAIKIVSIGERGMFPCFIVFKFSPSSIVIS